MIQDVASMTARVTGSGVGLAGRKVTYITATLLAVYWAYAEIRSGFRYDILGFDFAGTLWDPAVAIREGRSPYPAPTAAQVESGNPALYPPLLMMLVVPLTWLPWSVGAMVWLVLLAGAIAAALYALDVRDVRCYLLALVTLPVVNGVLLGNATLVLVPLVALAWRWRNRSLRAGIVIGFAIASKLFLWPLLFWLLGTRRYRAFGTACATAIVGVFVPWALIGFNGLSSYLHLLRAAEDFYAVHSYSIATALSALGAGTQLATGAAIALGIALALAAFIVGQRGSDATSVSLAILAAMLGSPIVWPYYYALLLVPLAIARPRFSLLWTAVVLFYVSQQLPRPLLRLSDFETGGVACCKPDAVPFVSWAFNHAPAGLWPAVGHALVATSLLALVASIPRRA